MAVHVREANLVDDAGILRELAEVHLSADADDKRFHWLYRDNPFGPARAWIACQQGGDPIGMAALFPRRMYRNGEVVLGCVLGDFCVSPQYRSAGAALQLQRACLACARSDEFAVAYDFPSRKMVSIYQHLGIAPMGNSIRLAKTLRAEQKIASALPASVLSRPVATALNFALALEDRKTPHKAGLDFRLQGETCSSEYSELARQVGSSMGICTMRTAEYLNWRYGHHPHLKYEVLTARRDNALLTYCIFTVSDGNATVVELFGDMGRSAVTGLLRELAKMLRVRGIATINTSVLSDDPRIPLLRKLGFWPREEVPVIGFARDTALSSSQMFLMHGDRES